MRIQIKFCLLMILTVGAFCLGDTTAELQSKMRSDLRAYTKSTGEQRKLAGRKVILSLLELSQAQALDGKSDSAKLSVDQAAMIAKTIRDKELQQKAYRQKAKNRTLRGIGKRLRRYKKRLKKFPFSTESRIKIIKLYLFELQQPAKANEYLTPSLPEDIRTYVPMANENIHRLAPSNLVELGRWYVFQAQSLTTDTKQPTLQQARLMLEIAINQRNRIDAVTEKEIKKLHEKLDEYNIELPPEMRQQLTANSPRLARSIRRAKKYLISKQNENGSWPTYSSAGETTKANWPTALVAASLLKSSTPENSHTIKKAKKFLKKIKPRSTFSMAIFCLFMTECKPAIGSADFTKLEKLCKKIIISKPENKDALTIHFATTALHDAAKLGVKVHRTYWVRVLQYWRKRQNDDGGFGYSENEPSTHISTLAGINDVTMSLRMLGKSDEAIFRFPIVANSLSWVEDKFDSKSISPMYHAYLVAQLMQQRGSTMFGKKDAGQWLTRFLFGRQKSNGCWKVPREPKHTSTALGLMAISIYKNTITK